MMSSMDRIDCSDGRVSPLNHCHIAPMDIPMCCDAHFTASVLLHFWREATNAMNSDGVMW